MGQALEVISGYATHPGSTFTNLTMNGTDSLTIRSFNITDKAALLAQWAFENAPGNFRIHSPRLHDNVQGIRLRNAGVFCAPQFWADKFIQPLYAQDTLSAQINSPTDSSGNIEIGAWINYYYNLPGIAANLISSANLVGNALQLMGQDVPLTPGSAGGYSGQVAINYSVDNFIANQWYALVGGIVDADCAVIGVTGADVGNLRVGFPGSSEQPQVTSRWFVDLSDRYGIPLIPCFNSANKFSIFVDAAQNQGGAAVNVTLLMVLLNPAVKFGA